MYASVKGLGHEIPMESPFPCLVLLQVFDNYAVTVMIGTEPYTLGLFDTAGELFV